MEHYHKKEINKHQEEINSLHRKLIRLMSGWSTSDEISSRKKRDWKSYDRLDEISRLLHRINEAEKYNLELRLGPYQNNHLNISHNESN